MPRFQWALPFFAHPAVRPSSPNNHWQLCFAEKKLLGQSKNTERVKLEEIDKDGRDFFVVVVVAYFLVYSLGEVLHVIQYYII